MDKMSKRLNRRQVTGLIAAAGAGAAASTLAMPGIARAAEFNFRLGHPLAAADATQTAMLSFSDGVKKRTGGRVAIQVFPADQLGTQKETGEMLVQGANILQYTEHLFLAQWVPDAAILGAPFLLNKWDDYYKIIKSDWMKQIDQRLLKFNIRTLSKNNYFGSRSSIGPKPIRTLADIKGETIREAQAKMYVEMAKSWGARPVVLPFGDVYVALSQRIVDFAECPPQTMVASKFTELRKIVSITNHMIPWSCVIISDKAFQKLPPDIQKIMYEEAVKAGDLQTKMKHDSDKQIVGKLEGMGLTVVQDVDRKAFRKASLAAYKTFTDWSPGLIDKVRSIVDS